MTERVLRGVAVAALLAALARSVWPAAGASSGAVTALAFDARTADSGVGVARTIGHAITARASSAVASSSWPRLMVSVRAIPSDTVRAVLGAAAGAGVPVAWLDSSGVRALALDARGASSPRSSTVIDAAGDTDSLRAAALVLRDEGGVVDSVAPGRGAVRVRATRLRGDVRATMMRDGQRVATARIAIPDSVHMGRVLLFAQPGWEAKFVTAALEESGWPVDGTLTLSPRARVRSGTPGAADTARYAAVVVLDSGVANARALGRFIGQGGGVVMAGDALHDAAMTTLADVRVIGDRPAVAGALLTDQPRQGLPALHLTGTRPAFTLERDGNQPVVIVRRQGTGRVLVSGYRTTWHWRMEGRDESADDHRRWWNDLVSAVAFATPTSDTTRLGHHARWPGDAAPVADLMARLGPASDHTTMPTATRASALPPSWLLFVIAVVALLGEWAMRRLRGAP